MKGRKYKNLDKHVGFNILRANADNERYLRKHNLRRDVSPIQVVREIIMDK